MSVCPSILSSRCAACYVHIGGEHVDEQVVVALDAHPQWLTLIFQESEGYLSTLAKTANKGKEISPRFIVFWKNNKGHT